MRPQQILADLHGDVEQPYIPHLDGLLISLGSYAGVGTVGPVWVRQLIARVMKIGAETRYLFNIGGVPLVLARGLLLRHEFVALMRWLSGTQRTPQAEGQRPGKCRRLRTSGSIRRHACSTMMGKRPSSKSAACCASGVERAT